MAKQVRTDSGTPKSQKRFVLTLNSRIPAEGCFEHEKIAKNDKFLTFFGDFRLGFALFKKRPYVAKQIVRTILRTNSGTPKLQKSLVFKTQPSFSAREVRPKKKKKKTQKNLQLLTLDRLFP